LVEYALVLAGVAFVAAAAAVLFLSGAINGLFGSTSNSPSGFIAPAVTQPLTPPVQSPTSVRQCLHGGWRDYPQFADEASCVRFVTGGG
jgi:hypothetical protein